jgi:hypothetical protein
MRKVFCLLYFLFAGVDWAAQPMPVILVWSGSVDKKVIGYHVYLGQEPGVYTTMLNITGRVTMVMLYPLTKTYAVVRGYDANGVESPPSTELSFLPIPVPVSSPTPTPAGSPVIVRTATPVPFKTPY